MASSNDSVPPPLQAATMRPVGDSSRVKTRFMPPAGGLTYSENGAFSAQAAAAAAAACCGMQPMKLAETDVTVFVAKQVVTMDPSWPEGTAVAVADGKILSVGTEESLAPYMNTARSVRVDRTFADKVLVPGFIDPHQHPLVGGIAMALCDTIAYYDTPNPYGPPIPGLKSKEAVAERLRHLVATKEPLDEPLLTWGYDSVALGGHLDADWLDEISPERPLSVWDCSLHFLYCNRPMLKVVGKVKPDTGVMFDSKGELTGQFLGVRALQGVVKVFTPRFVTPANAFKAMKHITDLSHQNGVTTIGEMMLGSMSLLLEEPLYREFYGDEDVPTRCVVAVDCKKAEAGVIGPGKAKTIINYIKGLIRTSTERLIFNGKAKFFSDDAFLGLGMQLKQPGYIDGHEGLWINEGREFTELMWPYWQAGLTIHVHSNGDQGNENTLACLSELQDRKPRFDHRFTFEHYGMSTQAISQRVKALGACCSVNCWYPHLRGEINEKHLGTDRAHLASRLKSLVDLGIPTAVHTDVPVAPPVPLMEMWIATERLGQSGKVLAPEERVTRYQALKMVTTDAAFVLGMDHLVGSIEAGKMADFTVLDQDPLAPNVDLRQVNIWGTVVGGRLYEREHAWEVKGAFDLPEGYLPGILALKVKWSSGPKHVLWNVLLSVANFMSKKKAASQLPVENSLKQPLKSNL